MPRLSIVIPALGDIQDLESTLISVLSHRPDQCEVVVVLNRPYDDPYQLTDEVRFVVARRRAGWTELAARGMAESQAPLVHLLEAGVEVTPNWTTSAVAQFNNPQVVAVAPLVVDRDRPQQALAAGLSYASSGRRTVVGTGLDLAAAAKTAGAVVGPTRLAGFYRKALVDGILGGFDGQAGDDMADADLALRAHFAGLHCVFDPRCQVLATAKSMVTAPGVRAAYHAERLFWRYRPLAAQSTDVWRHAAMVSGEFLRALPRPRAFAALFARGMGMLDVSGHRRHHLRLAQMRQAAGEGVQRVAAELRVDRSHAPRRVRVRMHRGVRPSTAHHDA